MTGNNAGDLIVVGSGIGGLAAAIRAHELGMSVSIVEKAPYLGGATAWSGGQVWVGANHVAQQAGLEDSVERHERSRTAISRRLALPCHQATNHRTPLHLTRLHGAGMGAGVDKDVVDCSA